MLVERFARSRTAQRFLLRLGRGRTRDIVADIAPYLQRDMRVVDVGAGTCDVAAALMALGHEVVPLDVRNASLFDPIVPVLYDGKIMPFDDDSFDMALLINVLHHAHDPDAVLRETARIAKRVVVQEDIYQTQAQRWLTELMDSVTNLEFAGHPHSNRDDAGWRNAFERLGLELRSQKYKRFWRYFMSATYCVERACSRQLPRLEDDEGQRET